jgi:hypothetical protein
VAITRADAEAIVAAYAQEAGAVPLDAAVVERDDLWFFGVGYIGSRGVIVDRADGRLSVLGSAPDISLDDCFWGHRRGFTHELAALTVTRIADLPATLEFLFHAIAEGPRGRNPWPRRQWLADKLGELPASFAPQQHWLAIPSFRAMEEDAPFEWRLDDARPRSA